MNQKNSILKNADINGPENFSMISNPKGFHQWDSGCVFLALSG